MHPPSLKVTVAIPTYNRADLLRQTLAGITQQTFPPTQFEVLVIDNNSTDHTRAVVAEFAGAKPAPIYVRETRQGLDYARNRAIAMSGAEIVLFGDDDILVEKDWVAQMAAPLLGDGMREIGAVGGEVIPVFPDGCPDWLRDSHRPLAFRPDAGPIKAPACPMGANFAFPRWVFQELGSFRTELDRTGKNYFSGGDSEMIRRVRLAELAVWFVPAAAVKHQMPASRTTFHYARRHAFDSARSRVMDRGTQPRPTGYLLGRFFANVAKAAGFSLLALVNAITFQTGPAKKALVRAWRSCGYLYQIPQTLLVKKRRRRWH